MPTMDCPDEHVSHVPNALDFVAATPWGDAVITVSGGDVTAVRPPVPASPDRPELRAANDPEAPAVVRDLAAALAAYLSGELVEIADRELVAAWLDAAGVTGFRRDVSLALFDVPRGMTLSYGELAALAGRPGAARAAGSTCARNPLPIVIPCHRVVHAGARRGNVGSYGAATGTDYKRRLLELEDALLVRPAAARPS
ncbi:MAG: methylated-DNA-[]-cysteine S-methyltransferase family protein [Thermoleophilia bacterium]|nr:methylated-DNA-[]-cysteine S-methyltransferase family protein [Thermoleophilia bacterium]